MEARQVAAQQAAAAAMMPPPPPPPFPSHQGVGGISMPNMSPPSQPGTPNAELDVPGSQPLSHLPAVPPASPAPLHLQNSPSPGAQIPSPQMPPNRLDHLPQTLQHPNGKL